MIISNPSPTHNEINSNGEHESARRTSLSPLRVVVSSTSKPKVNLNSNISSNNTKKIQKHQIKNLNIISINGEKISSEKVTLQKNNIELKNINRNQTQTMVNSNASKKSSIKRQIDYNLIDT